MEDAEGHTRLRGFTRSEWVLRTRGGSWDTVQREGLNWKCPRGQVPVTLRSRRQPGQWGGAEIKALGCETVTLRVVKVTSVGTGKKGN